MPARKCRQMAVQPLGYISAPAPCKGVLQHAVQCAGKALSRNRATCWCTPGLVELWTGYSHRQPPRGQRTTSMKGYTLPLGDTQGYHPQLATVTWCVHSLGHASFNRCPAAAPSGHSPGVRGDARVQLATQAFHCCLYVTAQGL